MLENKVTLRLEPGQAWHCEACRARGIADTEGIVIHYCPQAHPAVYPNKPQSQVFDIYTTPFPESKAKRDLTRPRYDLIPKEWLDCLASIFEEGAKKYGENNWQKGDTSFVRDCLNHAYDHLARHCSGDLSEDQLGKVAWNALAARYLINKGEAWIRDS